MRTAFLQLFPLSIGSFLKPCSIDSCRQVIDHIDDQIYHQLQLRMELSRQIAKQKSELDLKIDQSEREALILDRLKSRQELSPYFVEAIWSEIFRESKIIQNLVVLE